MAYSKSRVIIFIVLLMMITIFVYATEDSICSYERNAPAQFETSYLNVSNDESFMIFSIGSQEFAPDTFLVDFGVTETQNLSEGEEFRNRFRDIQLTSDDQYIVYRTNLSGEFTQHLFSMNLETGEYHQLSLPYELLPNADGIRYIISPNNEYVLYTVADTLSPVRYSLYVADISGGRTIEILPDVEFASDETQFGSGTYITLDYSRFSSNGRYFFFSFATILSPMQFYALDMETLELQLITDTSGIIFSRAGCCIQHPDYDYLYATQEIGESDIALYAFDIETGETTRLSPQFPGTVGSIRYVIFDESVTPAHPLQYYVGSESGQQLYNQSDDGLTVNLIQDLPDNIRRVSDGYWYIEYNFDIEPYEQSQYFIPLYDTNTVIPVEIEEHYRLEMEVLYGWRFGEYSFAPAISIDNRDDQILYLFHYDPEQDWITREIISPIGDYTNFRTPETRDNEQFYFVLDNRLFSGLAPFDNLELLTDETLIVSSVAHIFENGDLLVFAQEDGVDENSTVFMLSCNQ